MNETTPIRLDLAESKGPYERRLVEYDGRELVADAWGTTCPGCGKIPVVGESISKIFANWWHASCGAKHLRTVAADEAWLVLAHQLERAPSRFSNPETKAIVRNLLRIAGRFVEVTEVEPESVRGTRAILRSVDGGAA